MPTILMAKIGTAPFVERDEKILAEFSTLRVYRFGTKSWRFLLSMPGFVLWVLRHGRSADLFFARFAHYHAFLLGLAARLLRKKLALVLGGSDAIWIPRFRYGVYAHWLSRHTTRWALKLASLLLPNHESLIQGVNTYSDDEPRPEGILEYNPDITTRIIPVHNGYDTEFWRPLSGVGKEPIILAVAATDDYKVFATKGLDYYIRTAAALPGRTFMLIGLERDILQRWWTDPVPANLTLFPKVGKEDLRKLYSRAKVFAHFTLTEGMPNVLCEAMLCECVPVGSNVNSLPDIIGDCGFLVYRRNVDEMAQAIEQAIASDLGAKARARIVERFPLAKRKRELRAALETLLNQ